eukprot:13721203-Alexandrium_andersonii.AAC.1
MGGLRAPLGERARRYAAPARSHFWGKPHLTGSESSPLAPFQLRRPAVANARAEQSGASD